MSRDVGRLREPGDDSTLWLVVAGALVAGVLVVGVVWMWRDGSAVTRLSVAAATLVLTTVGAAAAVAARRLTAVSTRVDKKAGRLSRASDFKDMTEDAAAADAERLGARAAGVGSPLGTHLPGRRRLYTSWEWVQVWILGPRAGKTTCVCIPQVLEAAGPVLFTTNKPDGIAETRGPRSRLGQAWVHDAQGIVGEQPTWWWDPLSFVEDITTAEKLVDVFITSATSAGAQQDAYFTSAGKDTCAQLVLAAALAGLDLLVVHRWVNDPDDRAGVGDNPARILIEHGEVRLGGALDATLRLTDRQRDGVFGTVRAWLGFLANPAVRPWLTGDDSRRQFDPKKFVVSTDALYLVSKEGGGSTRALTAAMAMAVLTAAELEAASRPNGRLPLPLAAVLDEVANVVRWRDLPDVYSHYGSRGIVLSAFFQSWAQGVEAFGEHGMKKLWSAANVRVAGAGLSEDGFLRFVSELAGDHDVMRHSRSTGGGKGISRNQNVARERLFTVRDLGAMPRGRALLFAAGFPPALLRLDHYSTRPYAQDVQDSKNYYGGRLSRKGGQR